MKEHTTGQALGRYELLLPVAKGGMAQVWAARLCGTRGFQKIVAVKTILPDTMDDTSMEQMFLAEAKLASQIQHPNVAQTLELGEHEGTLYLVMEWVDGDSLNYIMTRATERGGVPLTICVNLIGQACKGLHAAHDLRDESGALLGLVHRDISPHNVLVTHAGIVKLVDFGIAKATAQVSEPTETGRVKGKFAYMAPEQATGDPVDRRADIFGMGTILYLLTTGRHPFRGANSAETLQNICSDKVAQPPSNLVKDYPPELEAVVLKALRKNPDDRWSTANEMLSALERAMPQCLDGSFEVQVADYMSQLLGERARDRRAQLKVAQELADRSRPDGSPMGPPGSYSSLRAISVDPSTSGATSRRPSARPSEEIPSVRASSTPLRGAGASRWVAAGGFAGLVMFVAFVQRMHSRDAERPAVAASTAPTATLRAPATAPPVQPPAPASSGAATLPSPDGAALPSASEGIEDRKDAGAAKRLRRATGGAPRAPPTSIVVAPAAPSPPSPAAEDGPRPGGQPGSPSNAWDPGSFGGRR